MLGDILPCVSSISAYFANRSTGKFFPDFHLRVSIYHEMLENRDSTSPETNVDLCDARDNKDNISL